MTKQGAAMMSGATPGGASEGTVFYEFIRGTAPDGRGEAFEIALHMEVAQRRPPDHAEKRERTVFLIELAEQLVQRVRHHAPFGLEMPRTYYTLHPERADGRKQPRLALTLSLVFDRVAAETGQTEPALLRQLRAALEELGVSAAGHSGA